MNKERGPEKGEKAKDKIDVVIDPPGVRGHYTIPPNALGLVLFAHGSGSSRLSPRNNYVAEALNKAGLATLLFDLLTPEEEANRDNVFDVALLSDRLCLATDWVSNQDDLRHLPLGYFGASTGAGAALMGEVKTDHVISAVVSRGGRPDLAMAVLPQVHAPTLLIVGGDDHGVIDLNQQAYDALQCEKRLDIIPGATHLFEEPGTLDQVIDHTARWFASHFKEQRKAA